MTNHKSLLALVTLVPAVTAASVAWAGPAASDGESPATLVARSQVAASPAAADPNIDRGFLQPTAMTQPAGSLTYNNYELLLHGLTYGITDQVQVSATVLAPLFKDMPFVGVASVKWQFLSTQRLHLAAQGSATMIHLSFNESDSPDGSVSGSVYFFGAGAFASYCLREDCSSLVSLNASYQVGVASVGSGTAQAVVYGGSIVHGVSRHVKLLGEITSAGAFNVDNSTFSNAPGALVSYGVRLHNSNIASDIGFIRPLFSDSDFLLGLPFINVSYRW
jgi:hypothetical protein